MENDKASVGEMREMWDACKAKEQPKRITWISVVIMLGCMVAAVIIAPSEWRWAPLTSLGWMYYVGLLAEGKARRKQYYNERG